MTRLVKKKITCPNCQHKFEILVNDSITVWMNPELILDILNKEEAYECPSCQKMIFINRDILINTRKGMFSIYTGSSLWTIVRTLLEHEVIDRKGEIVSIYGLKEPLNYTEEDIRRIVAKYSK